MAGDQAQDQQTLLDAVDQPVALVDEHAVVVWANSAWQRLQPRVAPDRRSAVGCDAVDYDVRVVSLGKQATPGRVSVVTLSARAGQGDATAGLRDELRLCKEELADLRRQVVQAQKLESVGRLTNGVAHDFNNMLTSIICFTRFVVDDMAPEDPRRADLIEVLKSADNAARLSSQLLAFSRRKLLTAVQLNTNEAVTSVGRVLRRTLGEHIELVIEPADEPLYVLCDPGQFDQLLFNLAVHAQDAMSGGGTITIKLAHCRLAHSDALPAGDYVELAVSDTGAALPADASASAFEAVLPISAEQSSGLGLATCRMIAEQAQGGISLVSHPGVGNTFRVLLPRSEGPRPGEPARRLSVAPVSLRGTVLVVEDHPAILRTMVRALASTGMRVLEAGSGEDALAVLEANGRLRPELVVTDVVLPRMSGPHLVKHLRASDPQLKALFVSGYVGDELAQSIRTDEQTAFVMKPFTGRQLAVRAAALLSDVSGLPL